MAIRKRRSTLVVLNEEELITQVHLRPILYDRTLKAYRKAHLRQQYWQEVSSALNGPTAEECRRRWRSLRDAFAKHYKQIQRTEDEHMRNKHRKWVFYDQMSFMIPCIDNSYEIDDQLIEEFGDNSEEEVQSVHCEVTQEATQTNKLCSDIEEDHVQQNTVSVQATDFMPLQEESVVMEHNQHPTDSIPSQSSDFIRGQANQNASSFRIQCAEPNSGENHLDSDEKFLLSCTSAMRRLTTRQNAFARLRIQQLLFNIEFGDDRENS